MEGCPIYSSPYANAFVGEMAKRRDASNQMIAAFAYADLVWATSFASTYALDAYLLARVAKLTAEIEAVQ